MCGLGLVGGAAAEPSGLAGLSGDTAASAGDAAALWRGETGVRKRVGLAAVGAGLDGEAGVTLRWGEEEDNGDEDRGEGVTGGWRAAGDTEKLVGVLNLASNSLFTAKLRLKPSDPDGAPNPELAAASEPLASS